MSRSIHEQLERDRTRARDEGRELARIACQHSSMRIGVALARLQRIFERKYRPDQPRLPGGQPGGGQFAEGEASGSIAERERSRESTRDSRRFVQYSIGDLAAEIPVPGGRNCVYKFDFGSVVVPGPVNLRCPSKMPSAAVSHGKILNEN